MTDTDPLPYIVLMPVYNDWPSAAKLVAMIDDVAAAHLDRPITLVMVDDGSNEDATPENDPLGLTCKAIDRIDVLRLRCNLGHQRAIAVGFCHIDQNLPHRGVVVMDSDGEDDPADIPKMIEAFEQRDGQAVILAKRSKRTEGPVFVICYWLYRKLFRVLTGFKVRSGNYCLVSAKQVRALVAGSDLWNHFGATVFRMRLPHVSVPTSRRPRIDGESKVGFIGLIVHGLSAISVFIDRACVRVMLAAAAAIGLGLAIWFVVLLVGGGDWARALFWWELILVLAGMQVFVGAAVLLFMALRLRDSASVVPARDYAFFIDTLRSKTLDPPVADQAPVEPSA